jgi:hypothetical protein
MYRLRSYLGKEILIIKLQPYAFSPGCGNFSIMFISSFHLPKKGDRNVKHTLSPGKSKFKDVICSPRERLGERHSICKNL